MKLLLLPTLLLSLLVSVPVRAADDEAEGSSDPAEARAEKVATIKEKMKYFESHVGEWVGQEHYEVVPTGDTSDTKDEWKGFFSLDGTHFEMHGKGVGDEGPTTYKWMCTYDADEEIYRAWYFDSKGNSDQFQMEWDDDKKVLVWTSEDEENERTSTFFMKVEGNEITGEGDTTQSGRDDPLIKHTMTYKKKKIRI